MSILGRLSITTVFVYVIFHFYLLAPGRKFNKHILHIKFLVYYLTPLPALPHQDPVLVQASSLKLPMSLKVHTHPLPAYAGVMRTSTRIRDGAAAGAKASTHGTSISTPPKKTGTHNAMVVRMLLRKNNLNIMRATIPSMVWLSLLVFVWLITSKCFCFCISFVCTVLCIFSVLCTGASAPILWYWRASQSTGSCHASVRYRSNRYTISEVSIPIPSGTRAVQAVHG
jgi:hypothetical protein